MIREGESGLMKPATRMRTFCDAVFVPLLEKRRVRLAISTISISTKTRKLVNTFDCYRPALACLGASVLGCFPGVIQAVRCVEDLH